MMREQIFLLPLVPSGEFNSKLQLPFCTVQFRKSKTKVLRDAIFVTP